MQACLSCVYTAEEVAKISAEEIQQTIEKQLQYDEYMWQQEQKILITEPKRAEGLHKALYQCRKCNAKFRMESAGGKILCKECGVEWELTPQGFLENDLEKVHIPDWYEWQRSEVVKEIENGEYSGEFNVHVEALPNSKGFIDLGYAKLSHKPEGFYLNFESKQLFFDHRSRESVQTEYNYRGKGVAIVLSTKDCCYYIYSGDEGFNPTRLQFAGEYYHQKER